MPRRLPLGGAGAVLAVRVIEVGMDSFTRFVLIVLLAVLAPLMVLVLYICFASLLWLVSEIDFLLPSWARKRIKRIVSSGGEDGGTI